MSDEEESQLVISLRNYLNLNDVAWDKPYRKNLEKLFTDSGWENVQEAFTELSEKEFINEAKTARFADMKKELFSKEDTTTDNKTPPSNDENNSESKTGGTTMAEENNTPTAEETTFVPTGNQKYACGVLKLNIEDYKSNESLMAAIEEASTKKGLKFENGVLTLSGGATISLDNEANKKSDEEAQQPAKEEPAKEEAEKKEEKDAKKPVGIDGESNDKPTPATQNTNEDAPKIADWIKKKIENYQKMANGEIEGCPKLEGYKHDKSIKDGFAADFNGGHIHYTSSDNVIVSKESGLIVFETLVTEPDNRGRPVNFGSNLDHEQAVKLLAACLLHDNPIGENAPQLSEADLKLIEAELKDRPDDLAAFKEKFAQHTQSQQQNTDANESEQPKPEQKFFDDETKKQIKDALDNQYKMAAMESSGKIILTGEGKDTIISKGNNCSDAEFEAYGALRDKQADDKKFLADKFIENPGGMRAIVSEMIKEKTNGHTKQSELTDVEKNDLATIRKTQISALRDKMAKTADGDSNQLTEHDKKILALSGRLNKDDIAYKTVTENDKEVKKEVKALEGKAKEGFEARNKDAIDRAMKNYKSNTK